jgi:RimJ/RimL family protein N-acetyltransferase
LCNGDKLPAANLERKTMKTKRIPFDFNRDGLRVRDFLSKTFSHYQSSVNWRIERWEYTFYFVSPFLANWREDPPQQASIDRMAQFLYQKIGLWETEKGEIAGVANLEHPDPTHPGYGEFFIQRHPEHLDLLPEMVDFAEAELVDPSRKRLFIYVDPKDDALLKLLSARGFQADAENKGIESEFDLVNTALPDEPHLPEGFRLQSMADENNLAKRCKAFGCAFNHPDPLEWPSLVSYEMLQQAPDYRKEQDIVIKAPDGEYAAFSLIWHDAPNRMASLEPVGTQPEFRRMGLAREAVFEGMRRMKRKGVTRVVVGSDQEFYKAIGFVPTEFSFRMEKTFS